MSLKRIERNCSIEERVDVQGLLKELDASDDEPRLLRKASFGATPAPRFWVDADANTDDPQIGEGFLERDRRVRNRVERRIIRAVAAVDQRRLHRRRWS